MDRADTILHHSHVIKTLPRPSRKNLADCWEILKLFPFNSGSTYTISVVTSTVPMYKAWRIALDSVETFQTTIHKLCDTKIGFIPYPKYRFMSQIKNYLNAILPSKWKVKSVAICSFVDRYNKYRKMWLCDMFYDECSGRHLDELPPWEDETDGKNFEKKVGKLRPLSKPSKGRKRNNEANVNQVTPKKKKI